MKRGRKKGFKISEETREKMKQAKLGKPSGSKGKHWKLSKKIRQKMSKAHKGHIPWNKGLKLGSNPEHSKRMKGRKLSEEHKRKISIAHKGKPKPWISGEKHYNWKGGITKNKSEYRKTYYANNRVAVINYVHKRRALKLSVGGEHSVEEWETLKKKYNFMCLCCKKREPEIALTQDHIIPLSKGGNDYISNIQPLCLSCNCRKNVKQTNYIISNFIKL